LRAPSTSYTRSREPASPSPSPVPVPARRPLRLPPQKTTERTQFPSPQPRAQSP
jgi:hypothetical protein